MSEWNPNYETNEDETNNEPDGKNRAHLIGKIALDCITDAIRPELAEMDPQERGRRIMEKFNPHYRPKEE